MRNHSVTSTAQSLLRAVSPVKETMNSNKILEMFHQDKSLFAIPVVNEKNRPTGIVIRQEFVEHFSKLYMKELKGKKPISEMMDCSPIIVDKGTAIEDVARIILDAGIHHMVSGLIITDDKKYMGMANGYDLLNEITRRKQKHLFDLAHYDQLTGLPNRTFFIERLKQAIAMFIRSPQKISLLFVDLDGFKPVNDTYGHGVGDKLLKEVASRLDACIREGDTVARLGGDEFVVMLLESDLAHATGVAERVLETVRRPYELGKKTITDVSASIGIAEYPLHADSLEAFLAAADKAMYVAKRDGKDKYAVFEPA